MKSVKWKIDQIQMLNVPESNDKWPLTSQWMVCSYYYFHLDLLHHVLSIHNGLMNLNWYHYHYLMHLQLNLRNPIDLMRFVCPNSGKMSTEIENDHFYMFKLNFHFKKLNRNSEIWYTNILNYIYKRYLCKTTIHNEKKENDTENQSDAWTHSLVLHKKFDSVVMNSFRL